MTVDYDALAGAYARGRSACECVVEELCTRSAVGAQARVLEVGCGTGDYISALVEATGCQGWGVEPSAGMRSLAPAMEGLQLAAGRAEAIPFGDDFFDFAFTVNVVHHMTDLTAWFSEAQRVFKPGGAICTVTESTEMIRNRSPLSLYWPATVEPEIARYPSVERMLDSMEQAGFIDPAVHEIAAPISVTDATAYRQRAFSSLLLISNDEFNAGLRRLESDLKKGPVQGLSEYVCLWGRAKASD